MVKGQQLKISSVKTTEKSWSNLGTMVAAMTMYSIWAPPSPCKCNT